MTLAIACACIPPKIAIDALGLVEHPCVNENKQYRFDTKTRFESATPFSDRSKITSWPKLHQNSSTHPTVPLDISSTHPLTNLQILPHILQNRIISRRIDRSDQMPSLSKHRLRLLSGCWRVRSGETGIGSGEWDGTEIVIELFGDGGVGEGPGAGASGVVVNTGEILCVRWEG